MAFVYSFLDTGLALGFMTALCVEVFFLMFLYNILKTTEERVKVSYQKIIDDYRRKEDQYQLFIKKAKEIYPDLQELLEKKKKPTEETDETTPEQENTEENVE